MSYLIRPCLCPDVRCFCTGGIYYANGVQVCLACREGYHLPVNHHVHNDDSGMFTCPLGHACKTPRLRSVA
jgi:hypothetical protein